MCHYRHTRYLNNIIIRKNLTRSQCIGRLHNICVNIRWDRRKLFLRRMRLLFIISVVRRKGHSHST